MGSQQVILGIDLGTTGNRVIAFAADGTQVASAYRPFPTTHPHPAWVEQDPMTIWETTRDALTEVVHSVGVESIVAIGLTNQRETTIAWDSESGEAICPAIVWQCRRTQARCDDLSDKASLIYDKTGLRLDPYFSATKMEWILESVPTAKTLRDKGRLRFGTVDTWVLWHLTQGQVYSTDPSNASRTMLYNTHTLSYDEELCDLFSIPIACLPTVTPSNSHVGECGLFERPIPIRGVLGDQQAALFAQSCGDPSVVKATFGTGLFVMCATGQQQPRVEGLVTTVGWQHDTEVTYALEGSAFVAGSGVQWIRDQLGLIETSEASEALATALTSNDGVYFVPALAGLGAPYWDPSARGLFTGLTHQTDKRHLCRAVLEAMAYQTRDLLTLCKAHFGETGVSALRVDGGASQNGFLMQFLADLCDCLVERPQLTDATAFGVAGIAGLSCGFWTPETYEACRTIDRVFTPQKEASEMELLYNGWQEAVNRSLGAS